MPAVSVLVPTVGPGAALLDLARSLDAQTTPATGFEVVVVDAPADGHTERLAQLAARRPNVVVVAAGDATTEAERLTRALEHASGTSVLVLAQRRRLSPRALELLVGRATASGADRVVGRVAGRGGPVGGDDDGIEQAEADSARCVALVRRSASSTAEDLLAPPAAKPGDRVTAVAGYACAHDAGGEVPSAWPGWLESPQYLWVDGRLTVTAVVRPSQTSSSAVIRAWLVLTHEAAEIAVPATVSPDERDPRVLALAMDLDPVTAAGGEALDDGIWDLHIRVATTGRETTFPLSTGAARSAVVQGRPMVARVIDGTARLDVGATRSSVVGRVGLDQASIGQSVHGAIVTLRLPDVHVAGAVRGEGRLLLDYFALPAHLGFEDGVACLRAYVGALAGVSRVRVAVGGGAPVSTGLRLRVDGAGDMRFEDVPTRITPIPGPVPRVQQLRRRVPRALEPAVHRLARVPLLRSASRRLLSR